MGRVQGQIVAGIEFLPCVDINFSPIILGCTLRATVAAYTGHLTFIEVTVVVLEGHLSHCALRGPGWAIPFYYNPEHRVMVGGMVSRTFPVWCEVLPATPLFYT